MQELYTQNTQAATAERAEINKVLRNTYALLALTLAFSALTATASMALNVGFMGLWMLLPYFVLLFLVEKNKNNSLGLVFVFALTGWLGFSIGPMLNAVLATAGYQPIVLALGGTALIFFGLSGYVLTTRKDLSFMSGFLVTGLLVAFVAAIGNYFLQIQGLSLVISCLFLALSSGVIAWYTSAIIHGGERNYISATVVLFVALYNVFTSLLHLITSFTGD